MEDLISIEEVAKYLNYSVHTIYPLAQNGQIPAYKLAGVWRFKKSEVDEWLEKQKNN